jgi:hypothetical protein
MATTFVAAKQALLDCTCLAHPAAGAVLSLAVDASATAAAVRHACMAALRIFLQNSRGRPVKKYFAFDREIFVCYKADGTGLSFPRFLFLPF